MLKINRSTLISIIIVAAVVLVFWWREAVRGPIAPAPNPTTTTTTATVPTPAVGQPAYNVPPAQPTPVYFITSPAAGDTWMLNQSHLINWNKATEITGGIYLVNAQTGNIAGWILSYTNPTQTSYAWDGIYVSTGRTIPTKITPTPGTYKIVVKMDNKPPLTMTSKNFYIVGGQSSQ